MASGTLVTAKVDDVWRALGTWGRYQIFQLFLVVLDFGPASFAILGAVFTGYTPEFKCEKVPGDDNSTELNGTEWDTYSYRQCEYDVTHHYGINDSKVTTHTCDRYSYAKVNTYSSEWNLVCSRSNLAALAQSLVLAGQGIGAMFFSHAADRFGRKTIHVIAHLGTLGTSIVMAFSTNIYMIAVLRLVAGTFQQGIVCTGKILSLEMFPKEVRAHMEVFTFLAWTGGIMILTVYGYAFQNISWRWLQIGLSAFSLYALFEWWMLDESVRWLLVNGKSKAAERILRKAARWNKVDYAKIEKVLAESEEMNGSEDTLSEEADSKEGKSSETNGGTLQLVTYPSDSEKSKPVVKSKSKKYNVIDIMKNPALRINTLILWYSWIVATGTYYGLLLVSSHLAGNRFVNFFLSGLIEVPGLMLEFYLFNKIGRKKTLILWYALTGISLIISTALLTTLAHIHAVTIVATVFSLIGKMAITGSFSTVFLYTPEIYPTNYRNSGLGVASSISRIGGVLAPFISNLALIAMWIPGAIFGGMCLLVTLLALRLPESMSHELPQTMEQCDEWEAKNGD